MSAMSHPENERYLETAYEAFDTYVHEEKYFEALQLVRELRANGFTADAMHLWEQLYTSLGTDYEKLLS